MKRPVTLPGDDDFRLEDWQIGGAKKDSEYWRVSRHWLSLLSAIGGRLAIRNRTNKPF